jgi:hypothetical protein
MFVSFKPFPKISLETPAGPGSDGGNQEKCRCAESSAGGHASGFWNRRRKINLFTHGLQ